MEIQYLQVLVMPNGEILCEGKTVGWVDKIGKYLRQKEEILPEPKKLTGDALLDPH